MASPISTTQFTEIEGLNILQPIWVDIYREDDIYRANAPALELWSDGLGHTPDEALEDLKTCIVAACESAGNLNASNAAPYALAVAQNLKAYVEFAMA